MPRWLPPVLLTAFVGGLFWLERRRPLRARADPGPARLARNLSMAAATGAVLRVAERPLTGRAARWTESRGWGLVPKLGLRGWLGTAATVVLLDYTLYWWHVLLHRVPLLWRCHLAHHSDLDLDASTALRFHFAEFVLSIPYRLAQIVLIGASPRALVAWQRLTAAEVVFHHANLRLPPELERRLGRIVVTPRLHGIHHSTVRAERDSNFSSGLTVWDYLHGTIRTDVPQEAIIIGVPGFDHRREVTLGKILLMPFVTPGSRLSPASPEGGNRAAAPLSARHR